MKRLIVLASATAILGLTQADRTPAETVPVSPGEIDRTAAVAEHCPTFSWTVGAPTTESYELAIWKLTSNGPEDRPTLRRFIPGGALSWTPGRSDCLENGSRFAWSVRAWHSNVAGEWSLPRLFATPSEPTETAAAEALAVLGRYLEAGGTLESLLESQSRQTSASVAARPVPDVDAQATRQAPGAAKPSPEPEDVPEDALTRTPSRSFEPALNYGFSAAINGQHHSSSVAVEGVFRASSGDTVAGFLGVTAPQTVTGDFVSPYLKDLSQDEIGVLGFSASDSYDNWGVVGVGGERSSGGRFLHSDADGAVDKEVTLAGQSWAIDVRGDVRIREGSISCPVDTVRVGAWCIHKDEQDSLSFENALENCWSQGMQLCPLDAIMACDVLEPEDAACSVTTDSTDPTYRIFVGDLHPPYMAAINDGGFYYPVDIEFTSPWSGGDAWVYAPKFEEERYIPGTDLLGDHSKQSPAHSFCCTMPR